MPDRSSHRRDVSSRSSIDSHPDETSLRRSFEGLLESHNSSETLPSLLYTDGEKPKSNWFRGALRLLFKLLLSLLGIGLVLWITLKARASRESESQPQYNVSYLFGEGENSVLLQNLSLPQDPMPVVVTDRENKTRWTVSIPLFQEFPLEPSAYAGICTHSGQLTEYLMEMNSHPGSHAHGGHFSYYHVDPSFIDIEEAEGQGLLPKERSKKTTWTSKGVFGEKGEASTVEGQDQKGSKVCESSLTFVMETTYSGFGNTMMDLWMAYGLAQKEGRAFFVDDRNWAYGKFSTFFRPPPSPGCLAPPDHHRLPCPHHARHLLVSSSTTRWTFGHGFNEEFEDPRKVGVLRQHKIFALLRAGYETLFNLADLDYSYLTKRILELESMVHDKSGFIVGVAVRHGDRHPLEYKYQKSYIPLDRYANKAVEILEDTLPPEKGIDAETSELMSNVIVATDDPAVYNSPEFSMALHAQEQVILEEDSINWEGGFTSDVFWNNLTTGTRELIGRSYVLDLAVVGRADSIICGVSSVGCRLLAVMMGWEKAIIQENWHNIDGAFDWTSIVW